MQESSLNEVTVIEPGKSDIPEDDTGEQALLSRIPLQSRNARKAAYLSWRATGFSVTESCDLASITLATLFRWREKDEEFAKFEREKISELQKTVSRDLIHLEFMRNLRLALYRDFKVLWKAAYDIHTLTPPEFEYLKIIRKLYTPQDMVVLERALLPEDDGSRGTTTVNNLIINVDGKTVEGEVAKRAAARELLARFSVNNRVVSGLPTDGDSDSNGDGIPAD